MKLDFGLVNFSAMQTVPEQAGATPLTDGSTATPSKRETGIFGLGFGLLMNVCILIHTLQFVYSKPVGGHFSTAQWDIPCVVFYTLALVVGAVFCHFEYQIASANASPLGQRLAALGLAVNIAVPFPLAWTTLMLFSHLRHLNYLPT